MSAKITGVYTAEADYEIPEVNMVTAEADDDIPGVDMVQEQDVDVNLDFAQADEGSTYQIDLVGIDLTSECRANK